MLQVSPHPLLVSPQRYQRFLRLQHLDDNAPDVRSLFPVSPDLLQPDGLGGSLPEDEVSMRSRRPIGLPAGHALL